MKKKYRLFVLILPLVLLLSGCGANGPITTGPSGLWNWFVYLLAQIIVQLGHIFGNNIGWGVIFSTLIVRCVMIPLYRQQNKATENMNAIQPELKKIQEKYKKVSKSDKNAQMHEQQEIQAVYKQYGVNPMAGCFPILIQIPLMIAFYDAIQGLLIAGKYTTPAQAANQGLLNLTGGVGMTSTLLGFNLDERVIVFAILAGVTTFISTKLSMAGSEQPKGTAGDVSKGMLTIMPIMIFVMGMTLPGALSIYWLVGNLVTIAQTVFFKRDKLFNTV